MTLEGAIFLCVIFLAFSICNGANSLPLSSTAIMGLICAATAAPAILLDLAMTDSTPSTVLVVVGLVWVAGLFVTQLDYEPRAKKNTKKKGGSEAIWRIAPPKDQPALASDIPPASVLYNLATIQIRNIIDHGRAGMFINECRFAAENPDPGDVNIHLNTGGGNIADADTIITCIRGLQDQGYNVKIFVSGICMSAGMIILGSVPPENRFCTPGAMFMIHHARRTTEDGEVVAKDELSAEARFNLVLCNNQLLAWLCDRYPLIPEADLRQIIFGAKGIKPIDYYFDAVEALALGVVAGVI